MHLSRREWLSSVALGVSAGVVAQGALAAVGPPALPSRLGIVLYSYSIRARVERAKNFADPLRFVEFCHERRADGVQLPLGARDARYVKTLRDRLQRLGMYLEGSVRPPRNKADADRFEAEVRTAKEAGVDILRTVMLGGRRYETFTSAEAYQAFKRQAWQSLQLAGPILARNRVYLAVENHKDYRAEELAELMRGLKSEFVGVCIDLGNNLALLEEPSHTVQTLAPWALTCHLKDMGVAEYPDGFLLAEVPLGEGILDLKRAVAVLRKARPGIRFGLEMITRDPLRVPCLGEPYWATFGDVPGRDLARTLSLVRRHTGKKPLPRISSLTQEKQLAREDSNVRRSLAYARTHLGL
jgi:sugar phosphate isomerase/epimerase